MSWFTLALWAVGGVFVILVLLDALCLFWDIRGPRKFLKVFWRILSWTFRTLRGVVRKLRAKPAVTAPETDEDLITIENVGELLEARVRWRRSKKVWFFLWNLYSILDSKLKDRRQKKLVAAALEATAEKKAAVSAVARTSTPVPESAPTSAIVATPIATPADVAPVVQPVPSSSPVPTGPEPVPASAAQVDPALEVSASVPTTAERTPVPVALPTKKRVSITEILAIIACAGAVAFFLLVVFRIISVALPYLSNGTDGSDRPKTGEVKVDGLIGIVVFAAIAIGGYFFFHKLSDANQGLRIGVNGVWKASGKITGWFRKLVTSGDAGQKEWLGWTLVATMIIATTCWLTPTLRNWMSSQGWPFILFLVIGLPVVLAMNAAKFRAGPWAVWAWIVIFLVITRWSTLPPVSDWKLAGEEAKAAKIARAEAEKAAVARASAATREVRARAKIKTIIVEPGKWSEEIIVSNGREVHVYPEECVEVRLTRVHPSGKLEVSFPGDCCPEKQLPMAYPRFGEGRVALRAKGTENVGVTLSPGQ